MTETLPTRGQRGSSEFDRIYDKYFNMLYRVCYSYMKNVADTEDVISDVFLKLLNSNPIFNEEQHEKAWLLRTAINQCKNSLKHWWRKQADIDDYQHLESQMKNDELLQIVLQLSQKHKDVIYLHYYAGYSTAEIAEILGKPPSSIRVYMHDARKLLRGRLENE